MDFDWAVDWAIPGVVPPDSISDIIYQSDDESVATPRRIASDRPPSKEEIQLSRKAGSAPTLGQSRGVAQDFWDFKEECEQFIIMLQDQDMMQQLRAAGRAHFNFLIQKVNGCP